MEMETARANIRELWDLLEENQEREFRKYGMTYHGGSYRDCIALHVNAGFLGANNWDSALPQSWWDDFYARVGEPPYGIVWSYGGAGILGGPYPVTSSAARNLETFRARGGRP